MTAKNQEYADLWARLEANQAQRRKSADCEKAIYIVSAQRERDFAERISDPDALLRMYGDRDTRVCQSPAVKLYDADHPVLPEKAQIHDDYSFMSGLLTGIGSILFVAVTVAAVIALLLT